MTVKSLIHCLFSSNNDTTERTCLAKGLQGRQVSQHKWQMKSNERSNKTRLNKHKIATNRVEFVFL